MRDPRTLAPAALLAALVLGGCATKRYVTAAHWHDPNTLFVAYWEDKTHGLITGANLVGCRVKPDNSMECKPQNIDEKLARTGPPITDDARPVAAAGAEPARADTPGAAGAEGEPCKPKIVVKTPPPNPDLDRDTFDDASDKCPGMPEVFNGTDDEDGCPDDGGRALVTVDEVKDPPVIQLSKSLRFKDKGDELEPSGIAIVRAVGQQLNAHPQWQVVVMVPPARRGAPPDAESGARADAVAGMLRAYVHRGKVAEAREWSKERAPADAERRGVAFVVKILAAESAPPLPPGEAVAVAGGAKPAEQGAATPTPAPPAAAAASGTPAGAGPAPILPGSAVLGQPCSRSRDCADGLACEASVCVRETPPEPWQLPGVRAGLGMLVAPGLAGDFNNHGTALGVMADVSPALGDVARYHFGVGYQRLLNGNGVRLEPLTFGLPTPVAYLGGGAMALELEPGVWLFNAEYVSAGSAGGWRFGSGLFAQAVLSQGPWYAFLMPVGLDFPYLAHGSTWARGFGMNYVVRFGAGGQF